MKSFKRFISETPDNVRWTDEDGDLEAVHYMHDNSVTFIFFENDPTYFHRHIGDLEFAGQTIHQQLIYDALHLAKASVALGGEPVSAEQYTKELWNQYRIVAVNLSDDLIDTFEDWAEKAPNHLGFVADKINKQNLDASGRMWIDFKIVAFWQDLGKIKKRISDIKKLLAHYNMNPHECWFDVPGSKGNTQQEGLLNWFEVSGEKEVKQKSTMERRKEEFEKMYHTLSPIDKRKMRKYYHIIMGEKPLNIPNRMQRIATAQGTTPVQVRRQLDPYSYHGENVYKNFFMNIITEAPDDLYGDGKYTFDNSPNVTFLAPPSGKTLIYRHIQHAKKGALDKAHVGLTATLIECLKQSNNINELVNNCAQHGIRFINPSDAVFVEMKPIENKSYDELVDTFFMNAGRLFLVEEGYCSTWMSKNKTADLMPLIAKLIKASNYDPFKFKYQYIDGSKVSDFVSYNEITQKVDYVQKIYDDYMKTRHLKDQPQIKAFLKSKGML
jgi:hypothetical protein